LSASLCGPTGVAVDTSGNVYVSDTGHNEVRLVNSSGTISDVAGNNTQGFGGDGGLATKATLSAPTGVALDALHNLFLADTGNSVVRKVNTSGIISTVAGIPDKFGYIGNGGPATKAKLNAPTGLTVDSNANMYISDTANQVIRLVNAGGTISTYAGTGMQGFSGDGGPATSAKLSFPTGSVVADGTAVYFSDTGNQRVRGIFNGPPPVLPETNLAVILVPIGGALLAGGAGIAFLKRRRHGAIA
jgi:LPXTG-motif cell wall-anchored protein